MQPKISVLIPTFNRTQFLGECLDSILAQTLPASQVIVINDGSTDSTREIAQSYKDKILYLETAQVGRPGAVNTGLEKVTGDYIWIFDDDDVALPNALERFAQPLLIHPEHGFSYSTFFFTTTQSENNRIGQVISELKIPDVEKRGFLIPLLEANFLGGAALFARTSCYKEVGVFNPALLRSQDYEMAVRIARRFTGIRVRGPATFHYRQHQGIRGSTQDLFPAGLRKGKWLEYDQMFFRELYKKLPLETYLPPGIPLEPNRREALLERLTVMASKLLIPEMIAGLEELAGLNNPNLFSGGEKLIIQAMTKPPYYRAGCILDRQEFLAAVHRLSASSQAIRKLRNEMRWAVLKNLKEKPRLSKMIKSFLYLFRLTWS